MSDQLVVIEKKNIMQTFTQDKGLDPYVKMIKDKVKNHEYDTETQKGRDDIKSLAHNVAKSKVYLDDLGKDLVAGWKKQSANVDKARKAMRDELIALKEEARQPLTDWEAEAEEKERIFQEKAAELKLKEKIESDWEIGLLLDDKYDRDIAEELQKEKDAEIERQRLADLAQKERDEKIAKDATKKAEKEKAQAIADAKQAKLDKIAAQEKTKRDAKQAKIDAKWLAIKTKKEKEDREKQVKINADNAEKQRLADVKKAKEEATQREVDRQAKIKKDTDDAQKKRENNKKNKGKVWGEIKSHLMTSCNLPEDKAKEVVRALTEFPERITINY